MMRTLRGKFTAICAIDADDGVRYETAGTMRAPTRESRSEPMVANEK